ncbi:MAG: DUF5615 family PIN-like protein [Streptosporangiaceae bacterium]|nr:DUF5615 family PIN-like protein [Streptosporangiaceae bacterium]MBV9857061.1 DUF5615 family PIN-like protein [Streptosporangiaceae bacterium]
MKLLLDEMLTPDIARGLRARGHDAEAVAGHPDWEGLSDSQIMVVARTGHRAIVTNNLRDYRPLHSEAITPGGRGHFGMIFIAGNYRRTKADRGRIITALEEKLTQYPGEADLADSEAWL